MTAQPLVCPSCRTWFEAEGETVRCPSCDRHLPAVEGLLDRTRREAGEAPALAPAEATDGAPPAPADAAKVEAAGSTWRDALAGLAFLAIGVLLILAGLGSGVAFVLVIGAGFIAVTAASAWLTSGWPRYEHLSGGQLFVVRLPAQTFKWTFWGLATLFYIASCSG